MGVDLSGGLAADREFVFAEQPADRDLRDSVNAWVWDEGDDVGFPRIGIEAVADQWETHDVQVNMAFANGRVLNIFEPGKVHDPLGADGRPRVLGAGPLSFELVEPFEHWRLRLDGMAIDNHVDRQMVGERPAGAATVPVELEVDIRSVVPPWESVVSTFSAIPVTGEFTFPVLHQAIVRYTWADETAHGMMERSTLPEQMDPR